MGTKTVLVNVRTFVNGCDLTGNSNKVELAAQCEEQETTNFGSGGWKELTAGLFSATLAAEGQWSAGLAGLPDLTQPDDALYAALGANGPWSVCMATPVVGDLSWFIGGALESKYQIGGQVGAVAPWVAGIVSSGPLTRGQVLHPPGTARTSSGSGTAVQVGAVPTGFAMYANLHILGVSGTGSPTITVKIQSDNASGFPSSTDQFTFAAATAVGGQTAKIPATITDDWWRLSWTISGSSPSFLFIGTLGLGPA